MAKMNRWERRDRKNLRTLKTKGLTKEYWEEILRREGLSMNAGHLPARVSYVGGSNDLDLFAGVVRQGIGRSRAKNQAD
jgi:hypothetical protein